MVGLVPVFAFTWWLFGQLGWQSTDGIAYQILSGLETTAILSLMTIGLVSVLVDSNI